MRVAYTIRDTGVFSWTENYKRNRQISRRMDTHGIIEVERFATFHHYQHQGEIP